MTWISGLGNTLKTITLGAKILIIAVVISAGLNIYNWYSGPKYQTLYKMVPAPYTALQSPIIQKVKEQATCVPTIVYKPTSSQTEAIEKKIGGAIPEGLLLNLSDIKPLPYGGHAATTVPEATADNPNPKAVLTIFPNARPFFEWGKERSVDLGIDVLNLNHFSLDLKQDLFRTGPAITYLNIGYDSQSGKQIMIHEKVLF